MIEAVTFDLWQTLMRDTPALIQRRDELRVRGMQEVLRDQGYQFDPEELDRAYEMCWEELVKVQAQERDMTTREQLASILRLLMVDAGPILKREEVMVRLEQAYVDPVLEVSPHLIEGVERVLTWLKMKGYKLGLISNTGRTPGYAARKIMDELGIMDRFDALTFSNELGVTKPHMDIFHRTLANLGTSPEVSCHVGDNLLTDVWGAQRAGMKSIYISGPNDPESDILPDAVITEIGELIDVLREWGG